MRRHVYETRGFLWPMLALLLAGPAWGMDGVDHLKVEARFNYDWLGQRYNFGTDDTLDLYDEKSVSAILSYGDLYGEGGWLENRATFSDRSVKNTLAAGWSSTVSQDVRWAVENQLELKEYRWRGEDLFGSSYVEDHLKIEASWPLTSEFRLRTGQGLTYMDYQKTTSYFRDHWLSQTSALLEWEPGLLWDVDLGYTFGIKIVPDTSAMNYQVHTLSSSAYGFAGWSLRCGLTGQLERRRMEEQQQHRDYVNLTADAEVEYDLGIQMSLLLRADMEQMLYDHPDEVFYDYWTVAGRVGLCRHLNSVLSVTVLPMLRRSRAEGTSIGETYREMGVEVDIDYFSTGRFWGQLSLEIGSRDYDESVDEVFYSGYDYVHPTLLASVRLNEQISIDVLADHEPEWHKQKEDDFSSSLFSCSLSYRFR